MDKNEITSVSDCKVNGNTTQIDSNIADKEEQTEPPEEKNGDVFSGDFLDKCFHFRLLLEIIGVSPYFCFAMYQLMDLPVLIFYLIEGGIFGSKIDFPTGVWYTFPIWVRIFFRIGVAAILLNTLLNVIGLSARYHSVRNTSGGIFLLSAVVFLLVSIDPYWQNGIITLVVSKLHLPHYVPHYFTNEPNEYFFKSKLGWIHGLSFRTLIILCFLILLCMILISIEIHKECKDRHFKNASFCFNAYAQAVCVSIASATVAFIVSVVVYVCFDKSGMYRLALLIPIFVAVLFCLLAYLFGANVTKIRAVRQYFDDPKFKELMKRFDNADDRWDHAVNLEDMLKDEMVFDLIKSQVLKQSLESWYILKPIARAEYVRLEQAQARENLKESKKQNEPDNPEKLDKAQKDLKANKRKSHSCLDWLCAKPNRLFVAIAVITIVGSGALGIVAVSGHTNQERKEHAEQVEQYASNPAVQELVANSENGTMYVSPWSPDEIDPLLIELIKKRLLVPSQSDFLLENDVGDRWYTFDAALIEACQQAQNNTAEDVSPP